MSLSKESFIHEATEISRSLLNRQIQESVTTGDFTSLGFDQFAIQEHTSVAKAIQTETHICVGNVCLRCAPSGDITPMLNGEEIQVPAPKPEDAMKSLKARRESNLSAFTGIYKGAYYVRGEQQNQSRTATNKHQRH